MSVLSAVYITRDAYLVCLSHALTTEREEVMGLLLGDIRKSAKGSVAFIWQVSILTRADKRKDRVEIDSHQLTAASVEAERLSETLGKRTRVIGWYHSHPHITVHPSHVDVRTQAGYQLMDEGFVGIIVSCFNTDSEQNGRVQVIAFQSLDLSKLDEDAKNNRMVTEGHEEVNIPLEIIPTSGGPNTFEKIVQLQSIIKSEDYTSYKDSLKGENEGQVHPLVRIHSEAVYQKSVCKLLEYGSYPLLRMLTNKLVDNQMRIRKLEAEKARLLAAQAGGQQTI